MSRISLPLSEINKCFNRSNTLLITFVNTRYLNFINENRWCLDVYNKECFWKHCVLVHHFIIISLVFGSFYIFLYVSCFFSMLYWITYAQSFDIEHILHLQSQLLWAWCTSKYCYLECCDLQVEVFWSGNQVHI